MIAVLGSWSGTFHQKGNWKLTNITPLFKKASEYSKENYRPLGFFPNVSKIYEQLTFKKINYYFEVLFSKYQCDFRQGLRAQYCVIFMLKKRKKSFDKGKTFVALLTDLSKIFSCLPHGLIMSKCNAYVFSFSLTRLSHSYLSDRKLRTKIN